jgi:predicted alpha/beta-fold hydrolase
VNRRRKREQRPATADFRPLPFLSNPHLQTLFGSIWDGHIPRYPTKRREVTLADGDRIVLHESPPPNWRRGDSIAILIHGLGGSHASGYMRRVTARLLTHGMRVMRMDLRGCGAGSALARRTYNGGCSADVRAALNAIHSWSPSSPLVLIGFSLGGNIALKLAGEAASAPVPGLERVAAVAPPIDLMRCAALISAPRNRLYELHFVRAMIQQVRIHQRHFRDLPPLHIPYSATLQQFDDLYTAPRGGFADALDYYQRASSLPLVPCILVPTLILTARDDPFISIKPFEELQVPSHVEVQISRHGGHLGFLGRDHSGGVRWAERRIVDWIMHDSPIPTQDACHCG